LKGTLRLLLVTLGCVLIVVTFNLVVDSRAQKVDADTLKNWELPSFELAGLYGDPNSGFSSADLRTGEVSVINFFASWCIPCLSEHRYVKRLGKETSVRIYGVNLQDDPDQAARWLADLGDPYARVGADPDGRIADALRVIGIPATFVVDGEGRVRYRHDGPITRRSLASRILPVVEALRDRPHL